MPVLVVDDNVTNRRILEEIIVNWHMTPTLAEGGQEALASLQRAKESGKPFPLVVTDMQMPDMDGFSLVERIKRNPLLAGATIMMLTSGGQRGDAARCRELGVAAYLTKPVKQSELWEAVLVALGKRPRESERITLVTRHSLREAHRIFRILLAEDNPVNQTLAIALIEKRGHTVVVAGNGREALALLEKPAPSKFDLVLMDVQMPEMDGLETTAAIREIEKSTGRHLPIVAMTAHALKGDEERCLAAGMDGYISKPIRRDELYQVIENHARTTDEAVPRTPMNPAPMKTLDVATVMEHMGGDPELLQKVVEAFWENCPRMLSDIRTSLEGQSAKGLRDAAHALKGSLCNFGTNSAYEAALKLETLGRDGILAGAEKEFAALEEGLLRLKPALVALEKQSGL